MSAYPKGTFTKVVFLAPRGDQGYESPEIPVAASQNIKKGDLLVLSSGKLAQSVSLPGSNNSGQASGGSLGRIYYALADIVTGGSPAETDGIPVVDLNQLTAKLTLRLYSTTAADSQQQDVAVGTSYKIGRWRGASANEWWYYLTVDSTNGDLTILAKSPESDPTDNFGLVEVGK
jgi:hypothetical protein